MSSRPRRPELPTDRVWRGPSSLWVAGGVPGAAVLVGVLIGVLLLATQCAPLGVQPTPVVPTAIPFVDEPVLPAARALSANLVRNPSFEEGFRTIGARLTVPNEWTPAWSTYPPVIEGGSAGPCIQPEYKEMCSYAYRAHSGKCSGYYFAFYSMTDAVLYQVIAVQQDQSVQGRAFAQGWASPDDTPGAPGQPPPSPGELYVSVGIDPDDRTDFRRHGVIWSPWVLVREQFVEVRSPVVVANASNVTLYLRAATKWAQKHGDVAWDDAGLYVVQAGPIVEPTYTPYPTLTPWPTSTPRPTYTPWPTLQPLPTYTPFVCPTCVPGSCSCLTLPEAEERWGWLIR